MSKITPLINTRVQKHTLTFDGPAEDFFEGALLGNGALGCVVTTRPDAIHVFFGHNSVWDRRVPNAPESQDDTFAKVMAKLKALPKDLNHLRDDPWFESHFNYNFSRYGEIYPRPLPCGSVLFGFDRRRTEVLGHAILLENGLLRINLLHDQKKLHIEVFLHASEDRVYLRSVDSLGRAAPHPFVRVAAYPDPTTTEDFPPIISEHMDDRGLCYRQTMGSSETTPETQPGNRQYWLQLAVMLNQKIEKRRILLNVNHPKRYQGAINPDFNYFTQQSPALHKYFVSDEPLEAVIDLQQGAKDKLEPSLPGITFGLWDSHFADNCSHWSQFWNASSIELEDRFLEELWYRNQYFLNCVLRPGSTCPGIFGPWMYKNIGTDWHGDYHLNYNTQQLFWSVFSSNHLDKHLPYVELLEDYLFPLAKSWANDYYAMRGASFPYCAVPVAMDKPLLLGADWSWGIGISAWVIQTLWWHWRYSGDRAFLEQRAMPMIEAVTEFMVDFLNRPECQGAFWGDKHVHVFPSLSQELYRLRPEFHTNRDALIDLAMIRYQFNAFLEARIALGLNEDDLTAKVQTLLKELAPYPKVPKDGKSVFVSVPNEDPDTIHNAPQPLMPVFPCNEIGLDSPPDELESARHTYKTHLNEGGNDLVFLNLQAARLGILDLQRFKRQVRYCLLPNGTCTDKNLTAGGRISDLDSFSYMNRMGIWVENFALPAVINECLMQCHNGNIYLFPNWPKEQDAAFDKLRTPGGFLVSARLSGSMVVEVIVHNDAPSQQSLRLINPWKEAFWRLQDDEAEFISGEKLLRMNIQPGQTVRFTAK
jgi:alpha-L-fucosidase 2